MGVGLVARPMGIRLPETNHYISCNWACTPSLPHNKADTLAKV